VTAVVAIVKIFGKNFGNSRNSNSGKLTIKSNERLNLKKKHLNSVKSHQIGLNEPAKDASEGLIVKKKTIRVLLDRYGASLGEPLCDTHNPTLGLFSCTF
jgi:hypothetical protein